MYVTHVGQAFRIHVYIYYKHIDTYLYTYCIDTCCLYIYCIYIYTYVYACMCEALACRNVDCSPPCTRLINDVKIISQGISACYAKLSEFQAELSMDPDAELDGKKSSALHELHF